MGIYRITFPEGFDDYAWEVESKGWLQGVTVTFDGKEYPTIFYDPVRLSQDIAEELSVRGYFAEPNLVVVTKVDRENIERAVERISHTGEIRDFKSSRNNESPEGD